MLTNGPLDLEGLPQNEWEATRQKAMNAPPAMSAGMPAPGGAVPGAPSAAPALVEKPTLGQVTPSNSTAPAPSNEAVNALPQPTTPLDLKPSLHMDLPVREGAQLGSAHPGENAWTGENEHPEIQKGPELGPLHNIGLPQSPITSYSNVPSSATGEDASKVNPPAPKPSAFQSFLSTMRDVVTGRPSKPGTIAGDVRGALGNLSEMGKNIAAGLGPGNAERIVQMKNADAQREMARAQMAETASFHRATTGIQQQKADTAEEKAGQTAPITVQEGDVYHTQLGVEPGTQLRPADVANLLKNKASLESKESEGALNRAAQLERTMQTTRFKSTPGGLIDTQTGQVFPHTSKGVLVSPDIAQDYNLPPEAVNTYYTGMELARARMAQIAAAPKSTTAEKPMTDIEGKLIKPTATSVTTPQFKANQRPIPGAQAPAGSPPAQQPLEGGPFDVNPTPKAPASAAAAPKQGPQMKAQKMLMATSPEGKQIAGTPSQLKGAGIDVTTANELPSSEVAKVNTARQITAPGGLFDLIKQDLSKISDKDMNIVGSRWQEFRRGQVGKGDPRFTKLYAHVKGLLATAVAQVHVGANGSSEMMEHFGKIADSTFMDKKTLEAALDGEHEYMDDKAMRLPQAQQAGTKEGGDKTQHVPGGAAQGLQEGATGMGSDHKPYIVKGGVWVPKTK